MKVCWTFLLFQTAAISTATLFFWIVISRKLNKLSICPKEQKKEIIVVEEELMREFDEVKDMLSLTEL